MNTLYGCKSQVNVSGNTTYRITKFDSDMNVEASYTCTATECECPAGVRPSCRHRDMLPKFIARGAVNTFWMYDFNRDGWVSTLWEGEPAASVGATQSNITATEINERMTNLPDIKNPLVEYMVDKELEAIQSLEVRKASSPSPTSTPILRRF